jgi:hypothetical protein
MAKDIYRKGNTVSQSSNRAAQKAPGNIKSQDPGQG